MSKKYILALILIVLVIAGVAVAKFGKFTQDNNIVATTTATSTDQVACTMEAKLCPDGSYVGRQGPRCEFKACPGLNIDISSWKKVTHEGYGFGLSYPKNYKYTDRIKTTYSGGDVWYIVNVDDPSGKASLKFEMNPDGYGPIFPNEVWSLERGQNGLIVTREEVQPVTENNTGDRVLITASLDNFYWTIIYPKNNTAFRPVLKRVLETFRIPLLLVKNCPVYSPPAPGWCADGKVVSGGLNSAGCPNPPKCEVAKECVVGGCSGTVCEEKGQGTVTTCEYRSEYQCYKQAICERQISGQCGWTKTSPFNACMLPYQIEL